jgi:hypothetical protein
VCSPPPPQQQQQQQQLPAKCLFSGGSFNFSRVSVSLKLSPSRQVQLSSRQARDHATTSDDGFLFLPMAAAADGSSFPPDMLQVSD